MFSEPLIAKLPAPVTRIDHLIARVPALEVPAHVPTVEEIHATDEVFQHTSSDPDNISGVFGMITGMMLLHDVAVDTIQDVDDLEGHLKRQKRKKDEEEEEDELTS